MIEATEAVERAQPLGLPCGDEGMAGIAPYSTDPGAPALRDEAQGGRNSLARIAWTPRITSPEALPSPTADRARPPLALVVQAVMVRDRSASEVSRYLPEPLLRPLVEQRAPFVEGLNGRHVTGRDLS